MIIVMESTATKDDIQAVVDKIKGMGLDVHLSSGKERTIIGVIGDEAEVRTKPLSIYKGVEKVMAILQPFKLVSTEFKKERSIIDVDGVRFGGNLIPIIAGPCSVETEEGLLDVAYKVKAAGASLIRGGAFKPRTSPYSFQGLGEEGLKILKRVKQKTGLRVVTELMDTRDLEMMLPYADMLQIGTRNMQNFNLLKEVGKVNKPILLKRGMSATIKEFLMSAEYILSQGNHNVILCERGIRTFSDVTRNTADISAIPVVHSLSHLPIIFDPSHAVGIWKYISPISLAAIAAGADGLIIEVHSNPKEAISDGEQSLKPETFKSLMRDIKPIARALGRTLE